MGNRTAPNENSHLWVVVNMLVILKGDPVPQLVLRFLKYVIAASHLKIKGRFESLRSKEYLKCFKSVKPEDIHVRASSWRWSPIEHENDLNFLTILGAGIVVHGYENCYPIIAANVLNYATTPKFELFNDKTCKEYHSLFIALVSQYQQLVDRIAALAEERESFENILDLTVKTGHALLTMVKGRAFHLYLSTIAPELLSLLPKDSHIEPDERDAQERNNKGRDNEGRDANAGTNLWEPVGADAATALWKPFKSWIMLILAQVEAANVLCDFMAQSELSQAQIDVKLVYTSLVSDQTIPLEELFQKKYIPPGPVADRITNAKLLDFVKTANMLKNQVKLLEKLEENWDPIKGKDVLQEVLSEAKKQHQEDSDQGLDPANEAIYMLSAEIIKLLSLPKQDANILVKITALEGLLKERQARYNLPFSEKSTFRGAMHCEAALASILDKTTRESIQARIEKHKLADKKGSKDERLYNNLSELLAETEVGFNLFLPLIPVQFTMVGLHASHRGIETLLPSVPSLSCLFISGWTRR